MFSPFIGPRAWSNWQAARPGAALDVVLVTHPRVPADIPRCFPYLPGDLTLAQARELLGAIRPLFGEIVEAGRLNVGILFLPALGVDMLSPEHRGDARRLLAEDALPIVAGSGARHVCLGGLTGSLTGYGRKIAVPAERLGLQISTGHASTAVAVFSLYERALAELGREMSADRLTLLGVGGIGGGVARLLCRSRAKPALVTLVDLPRQLERLHTIAGELRAAGHTVALEVTDPSGRLSADPSCYRGGTVISATSAPNVIDIDRVASGTLLIDDSHPYCWSRADALRRVEAAADIIPCDAGLVDAAAVGWRSHFPFGFADAGPGGSVVAWSCLVEGLLRALGPGLPAVVGEPSAEQLAIYAEEMARHGLRAAELQCGGHRLSVRGLASAA